MTTTFNSTAKAHYDDAVRYAKAADTVDDSTSCMCYTAQGQLSLELAKFAVANHSLVMNVDEFAPPGVDIPPPTNGPTSGPKFWGAPQG